MSRPTASVEDLYAGLSGNILQLDNSTVVYFVMGAGVALKLALWIYCTRANDASMAAGRLSSDALVALAEDHLNDVLSNTAAILTLALAVHTDAVRLLRH